MVHDGNITVPPENRLVYDPSVVTNCGRICLGHKKINFSTVFAGQAAGIKEVHDDIWLVSSMDYDLGYFDLETRVLEPLENPFGPKVNSAGTRERTTKMKQQSVGFAS
jgi:hypothetical protein